MTFTPQDWDMPQVVTVTASADGNRANGSATISHIVTGADYQVNGVTAASVEVIEWDAEGPNCGDAGARPDGTVIPDDSTVGFGRDCDRRHDVLYSASMAAAISSGASQGIV